MGMFFCRQRESNDPVYPCQSLISLSCPVSSVRILDEARDSPETAMSSTPETAVTRAAPRPTVTFIAAAAWSARTPARA